MLLDVFYFGPYKMNLPTNVASFCTDMVVRMSCMGLNRGFTYYYNRKEYVYWFVSKKIGDNDSTKYMLTRLPIAVCLLVIALYNWCSYVLPTLPAKIKRLSEYVSIFLCL